MAETKQTPGDATEPAATEPETTVEPAPEKPDSEEAAEEGAEPAAKEAAEPAEKDATDESADDKAPDATPGEAPDDDAPDEPADNGVPTDNGIPTDSSDAADSSELPFPPRVGWVVAAFLFFWPLAIPALVQSMRTAEANGTGNVRRAKKASVRTLDFALGAVTVGVLGVVGLVVAIAAAPTYASSLPPGFVSAARSFVPPALAGPLGITVPDDGPELAAPTDDPGATADPYAPTESESDTGASSDVSIPPVAPDADDDEKSTDASPPPSDTTATSGAEIPDLGVGDCIDTGATSGQSTLYRIPVVPCTTAHGGEIYAETTAPDSLAEDGEAPTQQALWDAADAYCYPQFAKFVGMKWAKSELLYWPIAPSEESWAQNDRRILCVVEAEKAVTGSLKGADR